MSDDELDLQVAGFPTVTNEFAIVSFGKVQTGNGERLVLDSPTKQRRVLLDPVVLDALTGFSPEELSHLVTSRDLADDA